MSEKEPISIAGSIGGGKSVVAITITGWASPACREELLMLLKMWAKRCGVKISSVKVTRKAKKKKKKK